MIAVNSEFCVTLASILTHLDWLFCVNRYVNRYQYGKHLLLFLMCC